MREFLEFCKVATPVFQEWTPKVKSVSQPDFGAVIGAMKQAKKPVDTDAVMYKVHQDAKAASFNQAASNPNSKMGKRFAKNNALYNDEIKPKIESIRKNNEARTKQAIKQSNKMIPLTERVSKSVGDTLKNHKLQAGLAGATLLAAGGAVAAKKIADKKKQKAVQQQAQSAYAQQSYQQPTYQAAAPYPSQQVMQPTAY